MKAAIFLIAVVTAVVTAASNSILSCQDPVPAVLKEATPAEVLLYLLDVVLSAYTNDEINNTGGPVFNTLNCPGGKRRLKSGRCPDEQNSSDYTEFFMY